MSTVASNQRFAAVFDQCRAENRAAFIAYLCAGDPDFDKSLAACRTLVDCGIDILELGVPFSDPLADGLTNQLAAQRALERGFTAEQSFDLVRAVRKESDVPLVFYTYYNLVFSNGIEHYVKRAKEAGVDGLLTLDCPPEEAGPLVEVCERYDMANIFIVAPTTPPERMKKVTAAATGFIYYVSLAGVTGERTSIAADIGERVSLIKQHTDLPVAVGFGISRPEHVREVGAVADGVVVGSSIVNCIPPNIDSEAAICSAIREKVTHLMTGLPRTG